MLGLFGAHSAVQAAVAAVAAVMTSERYPRLLERRSVSRSAQAVRGEPRGHRVRKLQAAMEE